MAITNAQIIAYASQELLAEGKIKPTGRVFKLETENGVIELPEAEPIHTFAKWKSLGYKVKKGEHAITRLNIWKYGTRHSDDDEESDEDAGGYCFRKNACFFAESQVEPIPDTTESKPA